MLETLITSKVRRKVLVLLFGNPRSKGYMRQISRDVGEQINAVSTELERLKKGGILISWVEGNMKYYKANEQCPVYKELRGIVLKEEGAVRLLRDSLKRIEAIEFAFVYGSFATGEVRPESDIDLMVIGKPEPDRIAQLMRDIEKEMRREINYTILPKEELLERKSGFMQNIISSVKIMVKGEDDELKRLTGTK